MGKSKITLVVGIIILFYFIPGEIIMGDIAENFYNILPVQMGSWHKEPVTTYTRENLFNYINGGAELYISYHFSHLKSVQYRHEKEGEITIDIFNMGNSYNAYCIFSHGRETEDGLVGQGSEYAAGLLTFWQDKYYVSILAYPETPEKREMVKNWER